MVGKCLTFGLPVVALVFGNEQMQLLDTVPTRVMEIEWDSEVSALVVDLRRRCGLRLLGLPMPPVAQQPRPIR